MCSSNIVDWVCFICVSLTLCKLNFTKRNSYKTKFTTSSPIWEFKIDIFLLCVDTYIFFSSHLKKFRIVLEVYKYLFGASSIGQCFSLPLSYPGASSPQGGSIYFSRDCIHISSTDFLFSYLPALLPTIISTSHNSYVFFFLGWINTVLTIKELYLSKSPHIQFKQLL